MRLPVLAGASLPGLLVHLAFAAPAGAYMLIPDLDAPGISGILIEKEYGDLVELAYLPKPHDRLLQPSDSRNELTFRWVYRRIPLSGPGLAQGRFRIQVDASGRATARFDFSGRDLADGAVYGAAAALLAADRTALHTFYARAVAEGGGFPDGRVALLLSRPPEWWRSVEAISFFYMQYPHGMALGPAGVEQAMRRAVGRVTGGQGVEQEE